MKDLTQVAVEQEIKCDMCSEKKAIVDGKTIRGPWAYMCRDCFELWGIGFGLGLGQKLKFKPKEKKNG